MKCIFYIKDAGVKTIEDYRKSRFLLFDRRKPTILLAEGRLPSRAHKIKSSMRRRRLRRRDDCFNNSKHSVARVISPDGKGEVQPAPYGVKR
jgi:hypothetical protein